MVLASSPFLARERTKWSWVDVHPAGRLVEESRVLVIGMLADDLDTKHAGCVQEILMVWKSWEVEMRVSLWMVW